MLIIEVVIDSDFPLDPSKDRWNNLLCGYLQTDVRCTRRFPLIMPQISPRSIFFYLRDAAFSLRMLEPVSYPNTQIQSQEHWLFPVLQKLWNCFIDFGTVS